MRTHAQWFPGTSNSPFSTDVNVTDSDRIYPRGWTTEGLDYGNAVLVGLLACCTFSVGFSQLTRDSAACLQFASFGSSDHITDNAISLRSRKQYSFKVAVLT